MKGYEIAKELNTTPATISRDIQYLTSQSQKYLDDLAKESLPFMYKTSIDGIREVLKECWNIYESTDDKQQQVNYFQRLAVLKLPKQCNEAQFKLLSEGPSIMYVQSLEEKLSEYSSNNMPLKFIGYFLPEISFQNKQFTEALYFGSAKFSELADFNLAAFSNEANFFRSTFLKTA
jgi:hypothetical protein